MKFLKTTVASAALSVCAMTTASDAALFEQEVASNAYITMNGLDWAWANPLPDSGLDLGFQAQFGWRLPTIDELLNFAPLATDFMFEGANVIFGGSDPISGSTFQAVNGNLTGDAACAAAYFSSTFSHCDWQDGLGQINGPWAGMPGALSFSEALAVRDAAPVPVPGAFGLMAGGIGAFAFARRKARK